MGKNWKKSSYVLPVSQSAPVYPSAHVQLKELYVVK